MARGWGFETAEASTAATETTAPVAGTTAGYYSFAMSPGARKVKVFNHPDSGVDIYVKWNATTAAKTGSGFDVVVEPGSDATFPDNAGDAVVNTVGVWIDSALTYGTNYVIQGWA